MSGELHRLPMWVERRGGLSFRCTLCGDCCRGEDGYVWVDGADTARLARALGLDDDAFGRGFLRLVDGEVALVDRPGPGGVCVFWDDERGCTVYRARPGQCRTFPFWEENLESEEAWGALAAECPGVRAGGRVYTPAEIERCLEDRGETEEGARGVTAA